jgi:Xaa-Pro aminopeptidase
MKSDLDRLMEERGLDAVIVSGKVHGNPPMKYMVGEAGLTTGMIVKKRGEPGVLIHGVMEREEALVTGFELMDFSAFDYLEIVRQGKGPRETEKEFFRRVLTRLGIKGRVGFYGRLEISRIFPLMEDLRSERDDIEWVREGDIDIFTRMRLTKDPDEVEAIRSVGRRTGEVIEGVLDFLRSMDRRDGVLVRPETGEPLRVCDVKSHVVLALAERRLAEEDATIFSVGYDTAVPHNRGKEEDVIRTGVPIIFDIFPADAASGYHYDCTRSFMIGEPTEEFLRLYRDVEGACEVAEGLLSEGASSSAVNTAVVDYFQQKGHPTLRTEGNFTEGYIHSLGHGIGLDVHEEPTLGIAPGAADRFEKGMVFTVEPGLYYPERSIGVRIEDCYFINGNGTGEKVVDIPRVMKID